MAATIKANIVAKLNISYLPDTDNAPVALAGQQWQLNNFDKNFTLTGSTTPNTDGEPVDLTTTIGASPTVHDLTAAPWSLDNSVTKDLTGKKLVGILLVADESNTGGITIEPDDGGNGYELFGSGQGEITLHPGEVLLKATKGLASELPAVAAGVKDIKVSGTLGDVLNASLVFSSS